MLQNADTTSGFTVDVLHLSSWTIGCLHTLCPCLISPMSSCCFCVDFKFRKQDIKKQPSMLGLFRRLVVFRVVE